MDFEKYTNGKLYRIFDIIYKMFVINLLWLITVVLGLGIFTFMPATLAVFILMKATIQNQEVPLVKTFFKIIRKEYVKSQKLFGILVLFGLLLYFNYQFYQLTDDLISKIGIVLCYVLGIIYILILTNIYLVYIYYPHVKSFRMIKLAFLISLLYSFKTFLIIMINVILILVFISIKYILILIPLFLITLIALMTILLLKNNYDRLVKDQVILTVNKYL